MILDAQLQFSSAQALTATANSTNLIDLGIGVQNLTTNLFDGEPMAVFLQVGVAADHTTGDETYAVAIQCDDNTAFSSATALVSQTILFSALTAGAVVVVPIPVGVAVERYLGLRYTLGGTTPSVTLSAYLQPLSMINKYKQYADNITIS